MAKALLTDEQFIAKWDQFKSAQLMADDVGHDVRAVQARRRAIESRHKIKLASFDRRPHYKYIDVRTDNARLPLTVQDGTVIVFSDAHFWPGVRTSAFKGLLYFIEMLKPQAVICNGDAFDGASISRHPRIGWDKKPSVIEEIKACQDRLGEIESAASGAKLIWPMGNHCARFETFLAANAPQFEKVAGFKLKDHFPAWAPCWSTWINDEVVVKHRARGGTHATHNNAVNSGKTIVTGHLHSLKVTPFDDYNGTRWGVDTGTLAEPYGPQFADYTEDGFRNHRSGFAVLTFRNGDLLWPEVAHAREEGHMDFRGHLIDVSKR
jgi:hypothetical protein